MHDLTNEKGLTFALLDNAWAWRERSVTEIELRDSDHVTVASTYQIRVPLSLIRPFRQGVSVGDPVRVVLPFAVRPKGELLLDVHFAGPADSPAFLLLRRDTAEIQASYLAHVCEFSKEVGSRVENLLAGICAYTSDAWARTLEGGQRSGLSLLSNRSRGSLEENLAEYLGADLDFEVHPSDVQRWLELLEEPRNQLVEALGEGKDPSSASECMLLAFPFISTSPESLAEVDELVESYREAVGEMGHEGRVVLAEYGRRWEMFLDTVVPAGQPCSVKLVERRPWLDAPSSLMSQEVAFGDAASTHVEIRAADHGVVIRRPRIFDLAGEGVGFEVVDAARFTADAVAFYASNPDRPYRARVSVKVWPRRSSRVLVYWLLLLIVLAAVVAGLLSGGNDLVEALALLSFPLTLAGAVVLARETTPLAERLLRRARYLLGASITGLWVVILVRMLLSANLF